MIDIYSPFYYPLATEDFPNWAIPHLKKLFPSFSDKLITQSDIVFQQDRRLGRLRNSKVLVIGGGPSTNLLSQDTLNKYDYLLSINKFYKHPILRQNKIDFISVGAEVDLYDPDFNEYIREFDPLLCFELHYHWETFKEYINSKLTMRSMCFQTKIYGQIGGGVRLINLAAACGVSQVDFIGLDGPEAILKGDHAFEPGKSKLPSMCNRGNAGKIHLRQYNFFWHYLQKLYSGVSINSVVSNKYFAITV